MTIDYYISLFFGVSLIIYAAYSYGEIKGYRSGADDVLDMLRKAHHSCKRWDEDKK